MIELSSELWVAMVAEAQSAYPLEGCGVLLGEASTGQPQMFVPIRNIEASPTEYTLDPEQYVQVVTQASTDGLEIVGIMHSHPTTPAVPSETDIERASHPLIPGSWHWVIVGLWSDEPDLRSYLIRDKVIEAEAIAKQERT